jgi:hypothetical protein
MSRSKPFARRAGESEGSVSASSGFEEGGWGGAEEWWWFLRRDGTERNPSPPLPPPESREPPNVGDVSIAKPADLSNLDPDAVLDGNSYCSCPTPPDDDECAFLALVGKILLLAASLASFASEAGNGSSGGALECLVGVVTNGRGERMAERGLTARAEEEAAAEEVVEEVTP